MPERLNGPVLKTGGRKSRGFESHPLRHAVPVWIAALLVIGCSLLPGKQFTYTFPALPDHTIEALPVVLTDKTGGVVGLADAPGGLPPAPVESGMTTSPAFPNGFVIFWTGGACDQRVEISAEGSGSVDYVVKTITKPVACDALGIRRSVLVQLAGPADPDRIGVRIEP